MSLELVDCQELFDVHVKRGMAGFCGLIVCISEQGFDFILPDQSLPLEAGDKLKVKLFYNRCLYFEGGATLESISAEKVIDPDDSSDNDHEHDDKSCRLSVAYEDGCEPSFDLQWLENSIIEERDNRTVVIEGKPGLAQLATAEKIPQRKSYEEKDVKERLDWISSRAGISGEALGSHSLETYKLAGNIEYMIGAVQIPVGLAGPMLINGHHAKGYFHVPVATSEGALVASLARGAYVLSLAGGVNVTVLQQQMIRAPQFNFKSSGAANRFKNWAVKNFHRIKEVSERFSRRAKLVFLDGYVLGKSAHIRFCYRTGDAAGQNMCTICTWGACQFIAEEIKKDPTFDFQNYVLEGNFSGDKKVNWFSFIHGRGVSIVADAFIPRRIMKRHLRVSPEDMVFAMSQSLHGATATGQIGNTANFANVIGGIFTACGQDIACVHESSCGQLFFDCDDDGLYLGCRIPNLAIGTVGGGTALPSQKECLKLLGCYGTGKIGRLAEIIGSCCLALDLSTCAALVEDTFAQAHDSLGRNRPTE